MSAKKSTDAIVEEMSDLEDIDEMVDEVDDEATMAEPYVGSLDP